MGGRALRKRAKSGGARGGLDRVPDPIQGPKALHFPMVFGWFAWIGSGREGRESCYIFTEYQKVSIHDPPRPNTPVKRWIGSVIVSIQSTGLRAQPSRDLGDFTAPRPPHPMTPAPRHCHPPARPPPLPPSRAQGLVPHNASAVSDTLPQAQCESDGSSRKLRNLLSMFSLRMAALWRRYKCGKLFSANYFHPNNFCQLLSENDSWKLIGRRHELATISLALRSRLPAPHPKYYWCDRTVELGCVNSTAAQ